MIQIIIRLRGLSPRTTPGHIRELLAAEAPGVAPVRIIGPTPVAGIANPTGRMEVHVESEDDARAAAALGDYIVDGHRPVVTILRIDDSLPQQSAEEYGRILAKLASVVHAKRAKTVRERVEAAERAAASTRSELVERRARADEVDGGRGIAGLPPRRGGGGGADLVRGRRSPDRGVGARGYDRSRWGGAGGRISRSRSPYSDDRYRRAGLGRHRSPEKRSRRSRSRSPYSYRRRRSYTPSYSRSRSRSRSPYARRRRGGGGGRDRRSPSRSRSPYSDGRDRRRRGGGGGRNRSRTPLSSRGSSYTAGGRRGRAPVAGAGRGRRSYTPSRSPSRSFSSSLFSRSTSRSPPRKR